MTAWQEGSQMRTMGTTVLTRFCTPPVAATLDIPSTSLSAPAAIRREGKETSEGEGDAQPNRSLYSANSTAENVSSMWLSIH